MPRPKPRNKKNKNDFENEWLLLGEPTSPRNTVVLDDEHDTSSLSTMPVAPVTPDADVEALRSLELTSDSDSSTDIDAVFDEYRQQIEVTTSGPTDKVLRIPSMDSWRISIILMTFYFVGVALSIIGLIFQSFVIFGSGILGMSHHSYSKFKILIRSSFFFLCLLLAVVLFTIIMLFLPRYDHSETAPNVIFCSVAILLESVLIGSTLAISLPAILTWIIAGE